MSVLEVKQCCSGWKTVFIENHLKRKVRSQSSQLSYTYVMMNIKLLEFVTPPTIYQNLLPQYFHNNLEGKVKRGIYHLAHHTLLPRALEGGWRWIMILLPSCPKLVPLFSMRTEVLSFSDVTGFSSTNPYLFTSIVLRAPTMVERVFVFMKKRQVKKVYQTNFFTPANSSPMSQVTRCRNTHSMWIARATVA